jgi:hypothetical protein
MDLQRGIEQITRPIAAIDTMTAFVNVTVQVPRRREGWARMAGDASDPLCSIIS